LDAHRADFPPREPAAWRVPVRSSLKITDSMTPPLITFAVASFNQKDYIREAIESAFAQSYSPLDIIISDDCSKDETFAIAQSMAAAYKGPHSVRLNRNPSTLGIGAHTNRLMELCRGELIVVAAGDDVSLPNRTE